MVAILSSVITEEEDYEGVFQNKTFVLHCPDGHSLNDANKHYAHMFLYADPRSHDTMINLCPPMVPHL